MSLPRINRPIALAAFALSLVAAPAALAHGNHHHKRPKARVHVVARPHHNVVRANVRIGPVRVTVPVQRHHHCSWRCRQRHSRPVVYRPEIHTHVHDGIVCTENHTVYYYDWHHEDCRYLGDDLFESNAFGIHYHEYE